MNTYIKHSEDDSLTHYGVKGMTWRKRKKKDWPMSDRSLYNPNDMHGMGGDSHTQLRKRLWKEGYATRREGFLTSRPDYKKILKKKVSRTLKSSKKAASKGYKKLNNMRKRAAKFDKKKQSSSSNKKHHKMSNALQMERARYAMKESRRLNNGMPTRSRARTIIRYKNY